MNKKPQFRLEDVVGQTEGEAKVLNVVAYQSNKREYKDRTFSYVCSCDDHVSECGCQHNDRGPKCGCDGDSKDTSSDCGDCSINN